MIEFKFRGWDGTKMVKVYSVHRNGIASTGDGGMIIPSSGIGAIMQYTGQKDRNGTEIYEGDIVTGEYFNLNVDYTKHGVVGMGCADDSDGWLRGRTNGWISSNGSSLADLEECEVIGNIYENPELLEQEND
jgi:uncharacterized phage protein (TIGR01671 family)